MFKPTAPNISFVLWSPKRSTTMLYPFVQLLQHCVSHTCTLPMVFKVLYGLKYLSHDTLQVPTLLLSTTNMDASMLEGCCICLHMYSLTIHVNVIVSIMTKWHWLFAAPVSPIWLSWCLSEAGAAWRGFICNCVQRSLQVMLLHASRSCHYSP